MRCTQPIHRSMQVSPNEICTILGSRKTSFADLAARVSRLAGGLRALGVESDSRVAMLSLNSDRYYEYYFAVPWAGGVVVPLNIRWSQAELIYSLNDSGASILFVDDNFAEVALAVQSEIKSIATIVYIGEGKPPEGMIAYEALIEQSMPAEDAMRQNDDLFGIFYTGGTTGFPKGVMLSHKNFYSSSMALMSELGLKKPGVRYLHAAPMFHIADAAVSMAHTIAGNSHVFIPAFEPTTLVNAIKNNEVSDVLLVPTMIGMLIAHESFDPSELSSLTKIVYGASPMPEGTLKRALEILPKVAFFQAYGQTELAPVATVLRPENHVMDSAEKGNKLRSAGQASIIVEIRIVDGDGNSVGVNQPGEVLVRGPNTMLGYWNNPEQTRSALKDGWVYTGDAGYLDEDGFLFLVDRVKDMIVTGGENVFSAEVEHVISQLPDVEQVAVIGIPDERWGEAVLAVVRPQDGHSLTESAIIQHCKELIAAYKCPRRVEFRNEPLPMTSVGKISKKDLRKPYWDGLEKRIN